MKKNHKLLSILLTLVMVAELLPAAAIPARAADDPTYSRASAPEVAIFNACSGGNGDYFQAMMKDAKYNAVEAGYFKNFVNSGDTLKYNSKITSTTQYNWTGFASSRLRALRADNRDLQIGFAVTRTSNYHKHTSGIYDYKMTSYSSAGLGRLIGSLAFGDLVSYTGYNKSQDTVRQGNNSWRFMYSDDTADIALVFGKSSLSYKDGKKTCTCGGVVEGCTVSFYDGAAPYLAKASVVDGAGNPCTNFKRGEQVNIVLTCSEEVRFADDSAAGKGNVYIALVREGKSADEWLYAHLTKLDHKTLTFTYDIPDNIDQLYDIAGINIGAAPAGGSALVHSDADVPLVQYRAGGNFTASAPKGSKETGITRTTSPVTDMAGNALHLEGQSGGATTYFPEQFYIDGEGPGVAKIDVVAIKGNENVKAALGKTNMDPADPDYNDNSDTHLGVGDRISLKVYMSEVLANNGGSATFTTNVRKGNGQYLSFTTGYWYSASAKLIGDQYGKGASKEMVSMLIPSNYEITSDMTIEGDKVKITGVTFNNVKDLAGNDAVGAAAFDPAQQYVLDTTAPTVAVGDPAPTGDGFRVSFTVSDTGSGVAALPASLTLGGANSTLTGKINYAITADANAPASWSEGAEGMSLPFTQTGDTQYLHVQKIDGERYDIETVTFSLADYAGNKGAGSKTLIGIGMDSVGPVVTAGESTRSYDNTANKGTLRVALNARDLSTVSAVQYQWTASASAAPVDGNWEDATLNAGTDVTTAALATVDSGEVFQQTLWARAEDALGNRSEAKNLGEYSYSLAGIEYALSYTTAVSATASVQVASLETGGALIVDVQKAGDANHYVKYIDSSGADILGVSGFMISELDDSDGYSFTSGSQSFKGGPALLSNYIGELTVTVYSGNGETIIAHNAAPISYTATTNAKVETFKLRYAYDGASYSQAFTGATVTLPDSLSVRNYHASWAYPSTTRVGSTLEGAQVNIDLGTDRNGWSFEDVDWENSYLALDGTRLCGIGSGPVQTVTLPASALYTTGAHTLALKLARHSGGFYSGELKADGTIYIDATEPGGLSLGTLAKKDIATDAYEKIGYDANTTIYLPTQGCTAMLSVEALDAGGASATPTVDTDAPGNAISYGAYDVVAWNAANPNEKVSLSWSYLDNTSGTVDKTERAKDTSSDAAIDGKRLLTFGETTDAANGVLGVTTGEDNVIALQMLYANGKASGVTCLTVRPVRIDLTGTVTTTPEGDYEEGTLHTVDVGTASVVFTPSGSTAGLTIYCQEGYERTKSGRFESNPTYYAPLDPNEEPRQMTPQGDGTFTMALSGPGRSVISGTNASWSNALTDESDMTPRGFYFVYAVDQYGNKCKLGVSDGVIPDGAAPVITGPGITVDASTGTYTATFTVRDDSLFTHSSDYYLDMVRPMELTFAYDNAYAEAIGKAGETLTLTVNKNWGSTSYGPKEHTYHWTADSANGLGIYDVTAELKQEGYYAIPVTKGYSVATYNLKPEDAYLAVTVKGFISPQAENQNMTLSLTAADAHGNVSEAASVTANGVTGIQPAVIKQEYKDVGKTDNYGFRQDFALYLTFNMPVQPVKSWINRTIEGYDTEWHDAFPIWKDGTWDISFTDMFGTQYTQSCEINAIGEYGFDLSFSTLDYVSAQQGVVVTAVPDAAGEVLQPYMKSWEDGSRLTVTSNYSGKYPSLTIGRWTTDGDTVDELRIYLDNIVSGGPDETLYFYFDEYKEQYPAGSQPQGETIAPVTVSYKTGRETSPVGETTMTFKNGDDDAFTFQYYDVPTDKTYTITGRLGDYGVTLGAPPEVYHDEEKPAIELVTIWKQQGGGFVQADAFPGDANASAIAAAFANADNAQGYDLIVKASDYSRWKVVVKSAAPTSMSYADTSDAIAGVSVSGNNVLVTKDVESDFFYIVVVDNAVGGTGAAADNFSYVRIAKNDMSFDTTPPEIVTKETGSLYETTVYIKATDKNNAGADTSSGVTLSGSGVTANTGADAAQWPWKLLLTENGSVVVTATDAAGNSTTNTINVTGIDMTAPELKATWSPCFWDERSDVRNTESPTAGPVNTDVVAHVTSDKEIKSIEASYTVDGGATTAYDFNAAAPAWGSVEYTSQRVTIRFSNSGSTVTVKLTVTAPNNRSAEMTLTLRDGVIDKTPPTATVNSVPKILSGAAVPCEETHTVTFDEAVYCMNGGETDQNGTPMKYGPSDPFELTMTENGSQTFFFSDMAGNRAVVTLTSTGIDSVAPTLTVDVPEGASASNGSVTVTVTADEDCTLTASDSAVVCGALAPIVVNGETVYRGTAAVSENGAFAITATDAAGHETTVTFRVSSLDKTLPIISFVPSTVSLRQGSDANALTALLLDGVETWDNVEIKDGTLVYDAGEVNLAAPGVYTVIYTVEDAAGNVGQARRFVKVIDAREPVITVDGALTERNGIISVKTGAHVLSVGGLQSAGEPYTIKLVKGIYSEGQMKRSHSGGIVIAADGSFTLGEPGFYTLYIVTQSRQTYRTLLYVEN